MFGAIAQLERDSILERQKEGIEIAKKGAHEWQTEGERYSEEEFTALYANYKRGLLTAKGMREALGLKEATFFRRLQEYEKKLVSNS